MEILTEEQFIQRIKHRILLDKGDIYFKVLPDNKFKVYYTKTSKNITMELKYSHAYWMDNLAEFLNDNWMEDIKEFKEQNPEATEEQLEAKNEELEKEFDERHNVESLKWYLDEAINNIPVWDIDNDKVISI
jgi:hypothetical protein